ncbi:MAG: cell division protein FtsA [Gemmatimonadetes bacterium]|nr:cell division protein FtsA [Gemmatimonadota bacterium]
MQSNVIAGLDIGSAKTCGVIAEVSADPADNLIVKILGIGQARTGGIRREVVTDIEGTTESVRKAMREAELMAGVRVNRVFTGVAGEHIHARTSNGVIAVRDDEIDDADVRRVHEVARAVVVPADREVLHVIPQEYSVDHRRGIQDPIGMAGTRLEADVYIITTSLTATQNLAKAVGRAGYRIAATIHEPLASAEAVLTDEERDVGVALIDFGGGTTELAIFRDGRMRHLASIPFGGGIITNDLARGLSVTFTEAEKAKERFGVAYAHAVDPREVVDLPGPGPGARCEVPREMIAHIIEQRLDEIMTLVAREIENAGELGRLGAGVVLTGGGAGLSGIVDVAQHAFGTAARVGLPGDGLTGLVDAVGRPQFAAATGLARLGAGMMMDEGLAGGRGLIGRLTHIVMEYF